MLISPFIILTIIGALFLLLFTLGFVYYIYIKDREYREKNPHLYQEASKVIEGAHIKAKDIIENAVIRAKETLLNTEYLKQDIIRDLEASLKQIAGVTVKEFEAESAEFDIQYKSMLDNIRGEQVKALSKAKDTAADLENLKNKFIKDLENSLKQVSDSTVKQLQEESIKLNQQYKEMLDLTREQYVGKAQETLKLIEKIPEHELEAFGELLKKQTVESEAIISKKIQEEFEKTEKDIQEYKMQRLGIVKEAINRMVLKVASDVLSKTIDVGEHEKLILDAFEKAKKEGLFNNL